METEAIAPYSPTTIYGQLTSPFTSRQITINAHTPFDEVDKEQSQVFSREHFQGKPQARMAYEISGNESVIIGINYENGQPSGSNSNNETEMKAIEVSAFSASQTSSRDIVNNSLKYGYSPAEAIIIRDAQNAYRNSAIITDDPVGALNSRSYRVF